VVDGGAEPDEKDVFSNVTGNGGEKKRVMDQKNGKMEKS
jgi:hypothetical protein